MMKQAAICTTGIFFLLLSLQRVLPAEVPYEVLTPATVQCVESGQTSLLGCCPTRQDGFIKPIALEDYVEYREYDDRFYCNPEICTLTEDFSLPVLGPAKVVCPDIVASYCRSAGASNETYLPLVEGGDTMEINGFEIRDTKTFDINQPELVICSSACEIRDAPYNEIWIGYVELECSNDVPSPPCFEEETNTTINKIAENSNRVIVDYFQVARCHESCNKVVAESIFVVGPAMVGCADCYLDRGIRSNATTIMDNSTTTGTIITEAAYGQVMKCPQSCSVIANSTEVQGPALITCHVDDDGKERESTLLGCQEENGTMVPHTAEFDNQYLVDTDRIVRCDSRCSIQGSAIVNSPANIQCTTPTFGCYDSNDGTPVTWEFEAEDGGQQTIVAQYAQMRCDANQCQVTKGNGTTIEGPAYVTCGSDTLGCETGGGGTSEDGRIHEILVNTTGRCDPNCQVVQHRTIHGPTQVECPQSDSTTGPLGFACVVQQQQQSSAPSSSGGTGATGNKNNNDNNNKLEYIVECGDVAHCNENCEIGGKKVGTEPPAASAEGGMEGEEDTTTTSSKSSGTSTRPRRGRIWDDATSPSSCSLLMIAIFALWLV